MDNSQALVSVIIPAFNASGFIERTLVSVQEQTYKNLEIVVVDDGSSDRTGDLIRKFAASDERIVMISQQNAGVGVARNTGIAQARGDFIAPIDADDLWYPEKIASQMAVMKAGGESMGMVYCWSHLIDQNDGLLSFYPGTNVQGKVDDLLVFRNFMHSGSVPLFRAAALEKVGGYLTREMQDGAQGCEDWDLSVRVAERFEVGGVPRYLVGYREVVESMSRGSKGMARSYLKMMEGVRLRNTDLSENALRWSAGHFYVYLAQKSFKSRDPICVHWLIEAIRHDWASIFSPAIYRVLLGRILPGVWNRPTRPQQSGNVHREPGKGRLLTLWTVYHAIERSRVVRLRNHSDHGEVATVRALGSMLSMLGLSWKIWAGLVALGILVGLTEGLSISLFIPLIQKQMGTSISPGQFARLAELFQPIAPAYRNLAMAGAILAGILLKNALVYAYAVVSSRVNATVLHRLRARIIEQILSVSQQFLDRQNSGRLFNTLNNETWRAGAALSTVASILINVLVVAIFGVILLLISWQLTLITATVLVAISVTVQFLARRARSLGEAATEANSLLAERTMDLFGGLRLIRTFAREKYEQQRYGEASQRVRTTFTQMDKVSAMVSPMTEILNVALLISILLYALTGGRSLATGFVFLLLLYRLYPRVKQLDGDRVMLKSLAGAVHQVMALADSRSKTYIRSGDRRLATFDKAIVFEEVSFRYQAENSMALNGISCEIRSGQTTALVGPSGAGKSSIINLIVRFYDPTEGRITVDGEALCNLDLEWWRQSIAVVSQDVFLFNASIAENIGYGKVGASVAEIRAAAQRAHCLEFIEALPKGFQTIVGDRGILLSGGQRQRLALARAFIRKPLLLILDEATNALDTISEEAIRSALQEFGSEQSVLVVAHRLNTIENADHVIVLNQGKIEQEGTAQHLRTVPGLFQELYARQYVGQQE